MASCKNVTKSVAVEEKKKKKIHPDPPSFSVGRCFPRRRRVQRADHVRLVPEGRREALLPQHGQRAEELLQREVLCRLPPGLLQEEQGNTPPSPPPPFLLFFLLRSSSDMVPFIGCVGRGWDSGLLATTCDW